MSDGGQLDLAVAVVERGSQRVLVARAPLAAGSVVCGFDAAGDAPGPGRHTLQVGQDRHVWLAPGWLAYVQHSCAPNVVFEVDEQPWRLCVLRAIAAGETLAAFYPATELQFAEPFACDCGAPTCLGRIAGASPIGTQRWGQRPMSEHVRRALGVNAR